MKFTKIKEEGNESLFLVEGVTPAFINSLRRACMSEVPVMAID
ncbi:MAG: DNA-directed RNA polymerase subunit D, partial [Candidatus Nanoarchaeia archaeon]|nr:DNA-directed RNA polymerase subunit D [Candidatus Haiyanarchaeum thermophilum]